MTPRYLIPAVIGSFAVTLFATRAQADSCQAAPTCNTTSHRVALVIGNSYTGGDEISGREDAKELSEHLCQLGYQVIGPALNANLACMQAGLDRFEEIIVDAQDVLFFFSGHGYQVGTEKYLVPQDKRVQHLQMPLKNVLKSLGQAPNRADKMVIVDACRSQKLTDVNLWSNEVEENNRPPRTMFLYSVAEGGEALSGKPGQLSPFSRILTDHIREPGLELQELIGRMIRQLRAIYQVPAAHFTKDIRNGHPFYFKDPIELLLKIHGADDSLVATFRGEVIASTNQVQETPLRLVPNDQELLLYVANTASFTNGQTWAVTEGWNYHAELTWDSALVDADLTCDADPEEPCLSAGEPEPFKSGPHHGNVFPVARATIKLDPRTWKVDINVDRNVWSTEADFWARDQKVLWEDRLTSLPFESNGTLERLWIVTQAVNRLLGLFGGTSSPLDLNSIYAQVRGNKEFGTLAWNCFDGEHLLRRMEELEASVLTAIRDPENKRPFDSFDAAVAQCMQEKADDDHKQKGIRIWTALKTKRDDAPANSATIEPGSFFESWPEISIGTTSWSTNVLGVPVAATGSHFLRVEEFEPQVSLSLRSTLDLASLSDRIHDLMKRLPLPRDNCARYSADNLVARIEHAGIEVAGDLALLNLKGEVQVWTCVDLHITDPLKTYTIPPQKFDATIPVALEPQEGGISVKIQQPRLDVGGRHSQITNLGLEIAGVDLSTELKRWIDQHLGDLFVPLPLPEDLDFINASVTAAKFTSGSGKLGAEIVSSLQLGES